MLHVAQQARQGLQKGLQDKACGVIFGPKPVQLWATGHWSNNQ
jgi:hypothetical protein